VKETNESEDIMHEIDDAVSKDPLPICDQPPGHCALYCTRQCWTNFRTLFNENLFRLSGMIGTTDRQSYRESEVKDPGTFQRMLDFLHEKKGILEKPLLRHCPPDRTEAPYNCLFCNFRCKVSPCPSCDTPYECPNCNRRCEVFPCPACEMGHDQQCNTRCLGCNGEKKKVEFVPHLLL